MTDEQKEIPEFKVPPPQSARNLLPKETGKEAFDKVREELNETFFKRPPIVQAHWMKSRNCQCRDCKEYFEEE